MQAQIDFHEELERQYDDACTQLYSIKQELSAYEKIMSLLKDHINENLIVQKRLASNNKVDERKQAILSESFDKLKAKYEKFRMSKVEREDDYRRQLTEKNQLEHHLNSMKTQIANIKKMQEAQENQSLSQSNLSNRNNKQQDVVFDYDVETINFLNECNWNLGESCDRGLAETLLSCFPSGTFLVRSSKTKSDSYALSVVADAKVRHCLVDKIDDGYCFHPPGPNRITYPNLCALVMDYRHKSLQIHNQELDTELIYPVLSQLKKTSKNSSGV